MLKISNIKFLAFGIFLTVASVVAQAQTERPAGNAAHGKEVYEKNGMCYTCHGLDGHGGSGARLSAIKMSQDSFMSYVRTGGPGIPGVQGRMPSFSEKVIPERDLADIYAYLRTLPASPAAKDIPLLKTILDQN